MEEKDNTNEVFIINDNELKNDDLKESPNKNIKNKK